MSFINVQLSGAVDKIVDPAKLKYLEDAVRVASVTAGIIKERVFGRGETATPSKPYKGYRLEVREITPKTGVKSYKALRRTADSQKKKGYYVSPAYAAKFGLTKTRFDSSAEFHTAAGIRHGTSKASGGMAAGLQVRNFGNGAIIELAGSSLGASSVRRATMKVVKGEFKDIAAHDVKRSSLVHDADGNLQRREWTEHVPAKRVQVRAQVQNKDGSAREGRKPKLVRNWEKGATVFHFQEVNVVQPTDRETVDLSDAFQDMTNEAVCSLLGGTVLTASNGQHGEYYRRIIKAFGSTPRRIRGAA